MSNGACVANTYTCAAGKYLDGTTCKTCEAGYACPGGTWTYNGGIQGRTYCSPGTYNSSTGQTSCSACGSGYFCTGGTHRASCSTTVKSGAPTPSSITSLSNGSWSDYTHAVKSSDCMCNWNFSDDTTTSYLQQNACELGPVSNKYRKYSQCKTGHYASDPLNWGDWYTSCTACTNGPSNSYYTSYSTPSTMYAVESNCPWACNANYYKSGSSCAACSGVSFTETGSDTENVTGGTRTRSKSRTCYRTTSAAGSTSSSACTGSGNCGSWSYGSWTYSCTTAGYYKNSSGTCSQCEAGNYCSGGVKQACPTAYPYSDAGSSSINSCYTNVTRGCTQNNGSTPSGCASVTAWNACSCAGGTYKKYYNGTTSGTTSNETCTKTPKTVTASANYYVSGTTCPTCSSLSSAYANSDNGNSSGTSACYTSCAAGTRVQTKNAACTTPAGSWYTSAHTVSYGSVSAVNYCMENWTSSSTSASGHDAKTDCTRTIGGGQYVPTTTINARYVRFTGDSTNSVNAYGPHIVEIQAFASADGSGTNLLSGISSNTGSAAATDGSWNTSTYDAGTNVIWDLGATKSLGSIKFAPYVGDGRTYYNIAIAVSTDKSTWTNVMGPIDIVTEGQSTAIPRLIVLSAVPTSCTAGTYKTSATLALGSTSSCTACGDGRYSAAGASSCSNISAGCYGTSASSACPAKCPAGKWSAAGASSCSNCNAGRYGSTEGLTAATCTGACSAGYYCPAGSTSATQNKCSAGNYCPAGSGSQTACPSGYGSSAAGSDAESDCYLTTTAGKYIATAKSSTQSTCTKGYYCPATNIYYGSTGKRTTCPAGSYCPAGASAATACTSLGSFYTSSAAGSDAAADCYGTTTAGKYIATANTSTQSTCTKGYYCPATNIYYGSTGKRTTCPAGSYCPAGASAATACTSLGSFYTSSVAGSDEAADCYGTTTAGKYIATANSSTQSTCTAGYYCPATSISYGSTGRRISCGTGFTSAAGSDASSDCYAATYSCSAGQYLNGALASCTTCTAGYFCPGGSWTYNGDVQGRSSCPSGYGSSAAGSDAATDCYLTTTAGKYIATANSSTQSTCTAGYYCPSATVYYGSTGTRTQCIANSSSAAGSDAISDCSCNTGYSLSNGACVANTYTVAYNANGGSGTTASSSHTYDIAKALTANGFSRTGYSFAGWATSADGGVVYSNKQSVSNLTATNGGTVTLYAVWTANCYTITFDPNGGTTNPQLSSYARTHVYKKYGVEGFYSDSACATTQMQIWEVNRAIAASFYREGYGMWPSTTKISDPITATSTVAAPQWNFPLASEPDGVTSNFTVYANYYKTCAAVSNGTCKFALSNSDSAMTVTYTTTCDTGYEFSSGANTYAPVCSAKSYTCAAGKYLDATTCKTCEAGYACPGDTWTYNGGVQGRTACGDGRYSSAGASSCSNISAGCYGTSASSSCPAVCDDNTYSDAGASSCSSCPTDYKNSGTTAASHAGSASCIITVTGGYYIGTAGDNSSNWDQCADGTYKASHAVAYGSTSSCSTCPDGYAGSDGTRAANTSCYAACSAKTITGGSTTVVNAKEYYNGSAYPACTYNVNCNARYGASGNKTSNPACTLCNRTQYSAGGTATCEDCSNAPEHAYYSGGPFASSACEWLCKAGYVNRTGNQCAQMCTAGISYLKSSTGVSIPLYTSAQTTHSIVVQSQSGAMCYANLAEGEKAKAINVNLNGTTYHAIY